jgi:hypothetical protein
MPETICRPALSIDIHSQWRPRSNDWIDSVAALGLEGRLLLHELLHVWQVLSQGYQLAHATSEWLALQHFRESGTTFNLDDTARILSSGDIPAKALRELKSLQDNDHRPRMEGLSHHDVYEGLTRYWEIVAFGAHNIYPLITGEPLPADEMSRPASNVLRLGSRRTRKWDDQVPDGNSTGPGVDLVFRLVEDSYSYPYLLTREVIGQCQRL